LVNIIFSKINNEKKVLALVGIRKLMDYMFTQKELSYLDDIMPEIVKRSKEDGKDVNEVDEFAVRKLVRYIYI
jgi:hypothetical protein